MPSSPLCTLTSASEEAPRRRIAAAKRSLFIFEVRSLSRTAKTGRFSSSPPLREMKSRLILLRLRPESHRFVPLSPLSPSLPVPPPPPSQRRQRTATSPLRLRGSPFTCVCRKWRYSRTGWLEGSRVVFFHRTACASCSSGAGRKKVVCATSSFLDNISESNSNERGGLSPPRQPYHVSQKLIKLGSADNSGRK